MKKEEKKGIVGEKTQKTSKPEGAAKTNRRRKAREEPSAAADRPGKGIRTNMDKTIYDNYLAILNSELIPALGCTEPIAIAYAAARARAVLGCLPEHVEVSCSGNIIKNVKGVTVPNSGGLRGIDVAAVLGIVGGRPERELEVLQGVTPADIEETKRLVAQPDYCACHLIEGVENLYIIVAVFAGAQNARVEIKTKHTHVTRIEKNGEVLFSQEDVQQQNSAAGDRSLLSVRKILEFADALDVEDVRAPLSRQLAMNDAIAEEGLRHPYGAQVGRTLLEEYGSADVSVRARARAAAGSDARMSGCSLPVVINSGSGNQGIAVSMPVLEYARELKVPEEKLYRALALANLISVHQKRFIGSLSAYCGATSAACGAACGIAYLYGASYEEICLTITNTIATIGGMVCDGAKSSCAAKIASAVDTGITAFQMSRHGRGFRAGEGLVEPDVEDTIQNLGRMGRDGMKETDIEILKMMIES